jgi:hypothetical protein
MTTALEGSRQINEHDLGLPETKMSKNGPHFYLLKFNRTASQDIYDTAFLASRLRRKRTGQIPGVLGKFVSVRAAQIEPLLNYKNYMGGLGRV